jgi:hypothetical protein
MEKRYTAESYCMPKRKENKEKDEELRDDALQTLKDKTRSTRVEDENGKAERKMIDFKKVNGSQYIFMDRQYFSMHTHTQECIHMRAHLFAHVHTCVWLINQFGAHQILRAIETGS